MTVKLPAKYDKARRALAECVRIDEAKDIGDRAKAMQVYAMQRNDPDLMAAAVDIRRRAIRRIGELMAEDRAAGKLKAGRKAIGIPDNPIRLDDLGIDKNLANEARKAAAMPAEQYDAATAKAVTLAVAAATSQKAVIKAARAEQTVEKRERRDERERTLAGKILALPDRRYGVIVADPEWDDTVWSRVTGMDRHASNHYPTSDADVIASRPIGSIAAADCVLFLWTTNQHLRIAIGVLEAWGFAYKSNYAWGKDKVSTGRWNRSKHEILLIGTRGKVPCPAPGTQWDSLIMAPKGEHSAKPECFLEMIESYYPEIPKIELNRRGLARPGWDAWGNEAVVAEAAE